MFNLKKHNTTVKTEVISGSTTFLAMLYIVPVNATIMSASGMPFDALITATAVMTIIASILNGLWSNTPVAMSVGMGLNAYFSFGLVKTMGIPWQSALGVVFVSGILYFLISITPLRRLMIENIPLDIKRAISAGIGAFIAFIGLEQMGIIAKSDATLVTLGNLQSPEILLGIFGLFLALFLSIKKIKGAFIVSIFATTVVAMFFGMVKLPKEFFSLPASMAPIAFEMDIKSVLTLSMIPVIATFLITDIFDTLGTLTGVGMRANLFEGEKSIPLQKTIEADAFATMSSGLAGVTSTTSFIESAAGVEEGGRTGLSAIITGVLFILTLFLLPIFQAIPNNAIYPILVLVGAMMFSELKHIDYGDDATKFATFFIVLLMPLTYSITNGLLIGATIFVAVKLMQGKSKELSSTMIGLSIISILLFYFI
jgi:AGZA family xanthine/uracil permease-like MFS transporter